jgi:hypothetical protein
MKALHIRRAGCWGLVACLLASCMVIAGDPLALKPEQQAQAQVEQVLRSEILGENEGRDELLKQAVEGDPGNQPAHWHQGEVRYQDRWVKAEEFAAALGHDRLVEYEEFRRGHRDTVEGNLAIANWCRRKGLDGQERAHLIRLLQLNPDHLGARTRSGFVMIDGQWVSRDELRMEAKREKMAKRAFGLYLGDFDKWARLMHAESEQRRQIGAQGIAAIDDPQAIVVIERRLLLDSIPVALAALGAINQMPDYEAALALARQAVLSPALAVREQAARYLRDRSPDSYVPFLLANLSSPVTTRFMVTRGNNGQMNYRHMFVREVQGSRQMMMADRQYQRVNRGGNGVETGARAVTRFLSDVAQRERQVAEQNAYLLTMNNRVCETLSTALEMELAPQPELWWSWWNTRNEVYMEGDKPTQTLYQSDRISIVDRPPPQRSFDCLAAGTPVMTIMGLRPIESLIVGDMVLSQDSETGELAYKAVMEATVRPRGLTLKIICEGLELETSGGHLFWVSGQGWVKSRELKPGMFLHAKSGSIEVKIIEESVEQPTYNLVVNDFHTFFVSAEHVLNHDNTVRQPTTKIVPGFSEATSLVPKR